MRLGSEGSFVLEVTAEDQLPLLDGKVSFGSNAVTMPNDSRSVGRALAFTKDGSVPVDGRRLAPRLQEFQMVRASG